MKHLGLARHKGIFKSHMSMWHAVAFVVSGTIGAGVLGLPYAISKVGMTVGMVYIVVLGLLTIALNVMLGEIVTRSKKEYQMSGLAREYIGKPAGYIMTVITYLMWVGVMLVYIIGEGTTLSALFGGDPFVWSLVFFAAMGLLVTLGMATLKTVDFFLSIGILVVILIIAALSVPHIEVSNSVYTDLAHVLLPYGVVLFAFSGISAIPEAHTLLRHKDSAFKWSIIIAGIINIAAYALFAYVVVGVTGLATTEVATIGLGEMVGPYMVIFGNLFALFAMATSFLLTALAFRDSLRWDYHVSRGMATIIVLVLPLIIFLLGLRSFIAAIDIVGGVLVSALMIMSILIYWRAKQKGHLKRSTYKLHHTAWLIVLLLAAFSIGAIYSVIKIF